MNTKYFLITVLIFCCMPFVKAQYVTLYTPMGSPVEGFIRGEELFVGLTNTTMKGSPISANIGQTEVTKVPQKV